MPTKRTPKAAPAPDGMWYEMRTGRVAPYMARWRQSDGVAKSRSFESESDRALFAAEWAKQRNRFGKSAPIVDAKLVRAWEEFAEITGGADCLIVAREWMEWRGTAGKLTLADAWAQFESDQSGRTLSPDSHSHRRLHGKRLCAEFGSKLVASITHGEIEKWLANLADPETGEPMGAKTRRHHLKTTSHLWEWLKSRRMVAYNPASALTVPDETIRDDDGQTLHRETNILTVEQARALFAANRGSLAVGRLALEAFGGLRYTSAARLRPEDIQWADSGIVMPGHAHKSGKRHYVDGWPANLWAWMKHAHPAGWQISRRQYAEIKRDAFELAGLKPKTPESEREWTVEEAAQLEATRNVLRHSFATYHLAAFKDASLTSYLMTKTSLQSLNNDYRGRASQADGMAYFQIVP